MSCTSLTSGDSLRREEAMRLSSRASNQRSWRVYASTWPAMRRSRPCVVAAASPGLVRACVTRHRPGTRAYVGNVVANVAGDVFEGPRAHRVTQHLGVELHQVD